MINNTMGEGNTSTRDMSTINNTMGEGSTSTRDMSTDKINVDLNEYPIEDISLENGYSGTVSEHFDHDIVANDVLEVEEIEEEVKEWDFRNSNRWFKFFFGIKFLNLFDCFVVVVDSSGR